MTANYNKLNQFILLVTVVFGLQSLSLAEGKQSKTLKQSPAYRLSFIFSFKLALKQGCIKTGLKRKHAEKLVMAKCNCISKVFDTKVTPKMWTFIIKNQSASIQYLNHAKLASVKREIIKCGSKFKR